MDMRHTSFEMRWSSCRESALPHRTGLSWSQPGALVGLAFLRMVEKSDGL